MSLYPIIWAAEHAPIYDAEERAILVALVIKGDFDGCNCFRSRPTLAKAARVDPKTVDRKLAAMAKRGLIRRQPGPKPAAWLRLPRDKRSVVWEALIPYEFWSAVQLEEINTARAERGREPITPENRPPIAAAPPKKVRADKGKPNPNRRLKRATDEERGDLKSSRSTDSGGTKSPVAGGLRVQSRGDLKSTNHLRTPSDTPSEEEPLPPAVGELPVPTGARAAADAAESKDSRSRRKPKPREAAPPAGAVELYRHLPERLREHVPEHGSRRVLRVLAAELEHRTAAELAERIARRGEAWAYRSEDAHDATAVAITIARRGYDCPDVRCEDHVQLDTGQPCAACTGPATGDADAGNSRLPVLCGKCENRWIEDEDEDGRPRLRHCPDCHPLAVAVGA